MVIQDKAQYRDQGLGIQFDIQTGVRDIVREANQAPSGETPMVPHLKELDDFEDGFQELCDWRWAQFGGTQNYGLDLKRQPRKCKQWRDKDLKVLIPKSDSTSIYIEFI